MWALMGAHVGGAAIGLLSGTASLVLTKGGIYHRRAGVIFVVSMVVAGLSGSILAVGLEKWLDVLSGLLAFYLVISSWATLRPVPRNLQVSMIGLALVLLLGYLAVEWVAIQTGVRRPDVPAGAGFVFAGILGLAIIGDLRVMHRGGITGRSRLFRHLWRMCFALFIASVSFFLSRMHLFPEVIQRSGVLYLVALAPILFMVFWAFFVRLSKGYAVNH